MRLPLLVAGLLVATASTAAARDEVVVDGARWAELLRPDAPAEAPLPGPFGVERRIEVRADVDRVEIEATFVFDTFEPGWLEARLFDQRFDEVVVLQDGGPAAWDVRDGAVVATAYVAGPTTFVVRATLHQSIEHSPVTLNARLQSIRGVLTVEVPDGLVPVVTGDPAVSISDRSWAANGAVTIGARPEAPGRPTAPTRSARRRSA